MENKTSASFQLLPGSGGTPSAVGRLPLCPHNVSAQPGKLGKFREPSLKVTELLCESVMDNLERNHQFYGCLFSMLVK